MKKRGIQALTFLPIIDFLFILTTTTALIIGQFEYREQFQVSLLQHYLVCEWRNKNRFKISAVQ